MRKHVTPCESPIVYQRAEAAARRRDLAGVNLSGASFRRITEGLSQVPAQGQLRHNLDFLREGARRLRIG